MTPDAPLIPRTSRSFALVSTTRTMFPRFTGRWAKFEGDVTVPVDSALLSGPKTMRCTHGTARAYPGTLRKTQETGTAHSRRNGTPRLGRSPGVGTQERKAQNQGRAGALAKQRSLIFP